jgi:hypothetical protein
MKILNVLGDEAAGPGVVMSASFVRGTQHELSVGLCRRKILLHYDTVCTLARSSGVCFQAGLSVPADKRAEY